MWPFKKKKLPPAEQKQRDLEALGKQVMALYDHINPDRAGLYRTAFLKGIVTGVGGVVGATLVIAVLVWTLSLFKDVPFIGEITQNVQSTIQKQPQRPDQSKGQAESAQ